jgi:large subunit ribosomal protein L25
MATSTISAVVATPREGKFNKNAARRVRAAGKIPAVVYGAGQAAVAVTVDPRIITKILHSDSGHNTIFDLDVTGSTTVKAMIVDWQNEPIKGALLHIDLKRIAMDKAIRVSVPVQLIGIPVGVKSMCCARLRSSAFPAIFPATWTPMSPCWRSTRPSTSPICRTQAPSSSSTMRA